MVSMGVDGMVDYLHHMIDSAIENGYSTEICTIERVTDACVNLAVGDLIEQGMDDNTVCWDILLHGGGGGGALVVMVLAGNIYLIML